MKKEGDAAFNTSENVEGGTVYSGYDEIAPMVGTEEALQQSRMPEEKDGEMNEDEKVEEDQEDQKMDE